MAKGRWDNLTGLGMIVVSENVVLTSTAPSEIGPDNPWIGWHNIIETGMLSADEENPDYPVTNLANPATYLRWSGQTTNAQNVVASVGSVEDLDYVGIATHNLGSAQISIGIEGSNDDGSSWFELVQPVMLGDNSPSMFRFQAQPLTHIRLVLGSGLEPPRISVLYVGKLLVLQRRLYVGHAPMKYNRVVRVTSAESESGHFLGRIVTGRTTKSKIELRNLTPDWVREHFVPFLQAAESAPFFFAWRPYSYPKEVGYAWLSNNPSPVNQLPNGMMSVTLDLMGVV